jgi:hypothetical protein
MGPGGITLALRFRKQCLLDCPAATSSRYRIRSIVSRRHPIDVYGQGELCIQNEMPSAIFPIASLPAFSRELLAYSPV